jgi:LacI family transcriptional regulator
MSEKPKIVGLMLPPGTIAALDSFLTNTIKYFSTALELSGYSFMIFNNENYDLTQLRQLHSDGKLAGIILFSPAKTEVSKIVNLGRSKIPAIVLFSHFEGVDSFTCDNEYGGYSAAKHLINSGRKKLAFLHGHPTWMDSFDRFSGFMRALDESGVKFYPEFVKNAYYDFNKAKIAVMELLSGWNKPDAVFCANDKMAIGALSAVTEMGLKIPGDIAVMGFDDILENQYAVPPLTTLAQPLKEIVDKAAERIVANIEGKTAGESPVYMLIKPKLIVRESA